MSYDLVARAPCGPRGTGRARLGIRWFDSAASLRSGWQRHWAGWSRRFGWQSRVWLAAWCGAGIWPRAAASA